MKKKTFYIFVFFCLAIITFGQNFTLETLYSGQPLIGAPPREAKWSPGEKACAFLWAKDSGDAKNLYYYSPKSNLKLEKLTSFEKAGISDFCWGRSDDEILYLRGASIFVMNIQSGKTTEVIKTNERKRSLSTSPNGQYVSFLQAGNLWLYTLENGTISQMTGFDPEKDHLLLFRWSPDSKRIALFHSDIREARTVNIPYFGREDIVLKKFRRDFTGDPTNPMKVGVLNIKEGLIDWLDVPIESLKTIAWSPSGEKLLIENSFEYADKRALYVADMSEKKAVVVHQEENPRNTFSWMWTSDWIDEDHLALTSDRDGYSHLYSLDLGNKELKQLTSGKWEVFQIYPVSEDKVYFIANKGRPENRNLFEVDLKNGKTKLVVEKEGVYRPFISRNGKNISVLFSDDMTPYDLYYVQNNKLQKISSSPSAEFHEYSWVETKYLDVESKKDGAKIRVKLQYPLDFDPEKKYPVIIGSIYSNAVMNQWGGRVSHPTWGFDQYIVQVEKYILMNIDIRGSLGHGRKFREDQFKGYGVVDIEDIESCVLYLKSLPYVKKDKIGIWGSSYGGLLTLMSLFKKPDLFACGIAGAPASNVYHAFVGQQEVLKALDDEVWKNSSAYYWSQNLKSPLMIIHGALDSTVLFIDSVSLVRKMIKEGKTNFEFVVLPEAYHGWDMGPNYQTLFAFKKMVDFFNRNLKN